MLNINEVRMLFHFYVFIDFVYQLICLVFGAMHFFSEPLEEVSSPVLLLYLSYLIHKSDSRADSNSASVFLFSVDNNDAIVDGIRQTTNLKRPGRECSFLISKYEYLNML